MVMNFRGPIGSESFGFEAGTVLIIFANIGKQAFSKAVKLPDIAVTVTL